MNNMKEELFRFFKTNYKELDKLITAINTLNSFSKQQKITFFSKPPYSQNTIDNFKVYLNENDILIRKLSKDSFSIYIASQDSIRTYFVRTPTGAGTIVEAFYNGKEVITN